MRFHIKSSSYHHYACTIPLLCLYYAYYACTTPTMLTMPIYNYRILPEYAGTWILPGRKIPGFILAYRNIICVVEKSAILPYILPGYT